VLTIDTEDGEQPRALSLHPLDDPVLVLTADCNGIDPYARPRCDYALI